MSILKRIHKRRGKPVVPKPTLALIMLVRDESDLIRPNLHFHHRQGFDRFVIMDNASKDGTREQLEQLAETLPLAIVSQCDTSFRQAEWTTELAQRLDADGVDWGVVLDADEFISSRNGSLKEDLAKIDHPVLCRRENMLPLGMNSRQPHYHPLRDSRLRVAKPLGRYPFDSNASPRFPVALRSLPGKVLFPLKGLVKISRGNHTVEHEKPTLPFSASALIRHYPVRPFEHFSRRLDHWEERFQRDPPSGDTSLHIRRWLRLRQEGLIEKEYGTFAIPESDLQRYLADGVLVEDSFGENFS